MIKEQLNDMMALVINNVDVVKVYCGEDMVWQYRIPQDDFVNCEYIQSSGKTQYINTGIAVTNKTRIEADMSVQSRVKQDRLFGVRSGNIYLCAYINGSNYFAFSMRDASDSTDWISTAKFDYNRHLFILDNDQSKTASKGNRGYTIYNDDGVTLYVYKANKYATNKTIGNNILIFNDSTASGAQYSNCRCYGFKIYQNGVLVRDFVPKYQRSRNRYGLWDNVEGKFYVSPNGKNFTGG